MPRRKEKKSLKKRIIHCFKKHWRVVLLVLIVAFGVCYLFKDLPSPKKLSSREIPQATKIYDREGELLYTIYGEENRSIVPISEIPKSLKQATIAIEDKDFYKHGAINPLGGILRAIKDMALKRQLQGGSTITQQLVKSALLTPERTIQRKIREFVLATLAERLYSKDQILEMYLNQVPYGGTAWGVEAAAQTYFGKHVKDLTLAESTLLAGLPAAPTYYSPFGAHPELAEKRQEEVLRRMVEDGYLKQEEAQKAKEEKLNFAPQETNIKAPHFVMYVKEQLVKKYGEKMVEQGGLKVTTTLDLKIQEFTQETVASEVAKLKKLEVSNGAALVTHPPTGEILAMVGSKDYFGAQAEKEGSAEQSEAGSYFGSPETKVASSSSDASFAKPFEGNFNVTTALRQPGSAIKPINYAVGLLKGYTPATVFVDQKTCFPNPGHPPYCPVNYDGKFHGAAQMRFTLGNSYNLPAVKMLKLNGVEAMIATASAMGITTFSDPSRYGLSLTLGGGEVKMTEMAVAFGVFANSGVKKDLTSVLKVEDGQGKILEENKFPESSSILTIDGPRVLPTEVTYLISHILLDNNARSDAFGSSSYLVIRGHPAVSVKTGTTDDKRDNWTIGYTPSYLVATWVGNNDNSPMNPYLTSGITGAAPIWNKIMTQVLKDQPDEWPKMPQNIVGMEVCTLSGKLPGDSGCSTRYEYFIRGTQPKEVDDSKQKVLIDKATGQLAKPGETENLEEKEEIVISDPLGDRFCASCPPTE